MGGFEGVRHVTERIFLGGGVPPVTPAAPPGHPERTRPGEAGAASDFRSVLNQATRSIRLSAHAAERLRQSGRPLSPAEVEKVGEAVDRAAAKGARESLILLRDLALVVSIPNRTVITAVAGERMKENVFTQIDSAVIVP